MFDFIYETAVITMMMIASLGVVACGAYLISIISFRLPFLFWIRHEPTLGSPQEFPEDVEVMTVPSDRANIAA
jgi:hypothetical protein